MAYFCTAALCALLLLAGLPPVLLAAPVVFVDATQEAGIHFVHSFGDERLST